MAFNTTTKKIKWPTLSQIIYVAFFFTFLTLGEYAFFQTEVLGRVTYFLMIGFSAISVFTIIFFQKKISLFVVRQYVSYILPFLLLTVYSVFISLAKNTVPISNVITTGLYWILPLATMGIAFVSLGEHCLDLSFNTILLNYTIVVIRTLFTKGFGYFFNVIVLDIYTGAENYLEVHYIGLCLPLFLIWYIFNRVENGQKLRWNFWIGVLYTLILGKRIALFGFAFVLALYLILSIAKIKYKKSVLITAGAIMTVLSPVYIILVRTGAISNFFNTLKINTMTRIDVWQFFWDKYKISPMFLGKGSGYCMYELSILGGIKTSSNIFYKVGDVHNDFLKMFVEIGFIPFILFFGWFFLWNIRKFLKAGFEKAALIYLMLSIFSFFLMLTDNALRYGLFLFAFFMIPTVAACGDRNRIERLSSAAQAKTLRKPKYS